MANMRHLDLNMLAAAASDGRKDRDVISVPHSRRKLRLKTNVVVITKYVDEAMHSSVRHEAIFNAWILRLNLVDDFQNIFSGRLDFFLISGKWT
jgi:hypothetical protein